jgi:benzoyl-CoA reductase/2-hydroxyglutaryl-CoA dehydratase subunit BcrC/BadD/HgdB
MSCPKPACRIASPAEALIDDSPRVWFTQMIDHCYDYAVAAKEQGRPIVGIMCEYTPRELIMAAGAVPVCLCGGSAATIPVAEEQLPSNLCPLIKSTYGYHLQKNNPFLEMADLIVAETTCDGKKKMLELLAETRPTHLLELPQKSHDPDAETHWRRELYKLKAALEFRFGVTITDEKLRAAVAVMNQERSLRRKLAELMTADSPPLTGRELLNYKSSISCIPEDLEQYQRALDYYAAAAPCPERASRARVLLTGVPTVSGAERVVEIIEDKGGLIVCQENCTGLKPILEDVDASAPNLLQALAEKYFALHCSVMTKNQNRLDWLARLVEEYRPDCIIELIWQACLTYDVESHFVRRLAEDLGLPYLKIETDYSPSDSERIAVRVEALYETVHQRKTMKSAPAVD